MSAYEHVWYASERHDVLASRWDLVDGWSRLAVALAASLSAVSLFAENAALTGVFAITTAVVSALNAAWEPAQRSSRHRRAAKDYRHIERPLTELTSVAQARIEQTTYVDRVAYDPEGRPYDAGWYEAGELEADELKQFGDDLASCLDVMDEVDDAAPPLNRLIGTNADGSPRTRVGLIRMRRQYERQLKASMIRADYAKKARDLALEDIPELS